MIKKIVKCMLCLFVVIGLVTNNVATNNNGDMSLGEWVHAQSLGMNQALVLPRNADNPGVNQEGMRIDRVQSILISSCESVISLDFRGFDALECIMITDCRLLRHVRFPSQVRIVDLSGNESLREINDLENCSELNHLTIKGCGLTELSIPNGVQMVNLSGNGSLGEINGLKDCNELYDLTIRGSDLIELSLPNRVQRVKLSDNRFLREINGLEDCTDLEEFIITRCPLLRIRSYDEIEEVNVVDQIRF